MSFAFELMLDGGLRKPKARPEGKAAPARPQESGVHGREERLGLRSAWKVELSLLISLWVCGWQARLC